MPVAIFKGGSASEKDSPCLLLSIFYSRFILQLVRELFWFSGDTLRFSPAHLSFFVLLPNPLTQKIERQLEEGFMSSRIAGLLVQCPLNEQPHLLTSFKLMGMSERDGMR